MSPIAQDCEASKPAIIDAAVIQYEEKHFRKKVLDIKKNLPPPEPEDGWSYLCAMTANENNTKEEVIMFYGPLPNPEAEEDADDADATQEEGRETEEECDNFDYANSNMGSDD